jgi:hypothetical protein
MIVKEFGGFGFYRGGRERGEDEDEDEDEERKKERW